MTFWHLIFISRNKRNISGLSGRARKTESFPNVLAINCSSVSNLAYQTGIASLKINNSIIVLSIILNRLSPVKIWWCHVESDYSLLSLCKLSCQNFNANLCIVHILNLSNYFFILINIDLLLMIYS